MPPLNTILCTVDFSRHTDAVIGMGVRLAEGFRGRLILFHSVHFPSDALHNTDAFEKNRKRRLQRQAAEEKMRAAMAETTVPWDVLVACGDPVETLASAVAATSPDLIVGASHGLSGFQRMFMGTVIERAVRKTACPFLVLRPGREKPGGADPSRIRCIVAACGPRPQTDPVPRFAWDMARRFQAQLHLVHALERPVDEDILDPTDGPYFQVQEELQRRIRWRLMDALSDVANDPGDVQTAVEPGAPGEVVLGYARRLSADLIIVGVRPQTPLRKTIVESTTETLLRNAPCSVLTLPVPQ